MKVQLIPRHLWKLITLLTALSLLILVAPWSRDGTPPVQASQGCNPNLANLPAPDLEDHPTWVSMYNKAWALAKLNIHFGNPPLTDCWIDEAYSNAYTNMWDEVLIAHYARYAYWEFPAIETLNNYYQSQEPNGHIGRIFRESNGAGGGQINPPIFAWGEWDSYLLTGDISRFTQVIPITGGGSKTVLRVLVDYYNFIKNSTIYHHADGTYAWSDVIESGMDNTLAQGYSYVDLSAEQAVAALYISKIAAEIGDTATANTFTTEYNAVKSVLNTKHWDSADGWYYNLNLNGTFLKRKAAQQFWVMLAQVPNATQAASVVNNHLLNPNEFWRLNPIPSTSADDPDYDPGGGYARGSTIISTNYSSIKGLEAIGYEDTAHLMTMKYLDVMAQVYVNTGTIWENYAPDFISPGNRSKPDFVGWSGLGPISLLIENVLGLRVNAPSDELVWHLRLVERHGLSNFHFGDNIVSLSSARRANAADGARLTVTTNSAFDLTVNVIGGPTCNRSVTVGTTVFDCGTFSGGATPTAGPSPTSTPTTSGPTATLTRTNTPVPPTNTPTRTNTPSGPTNTPTNTPTRTNTPINPTATNTPSTGTNLALNKPATVSSFSSTSQDGSEAVDGNISTYWRTQKGSSLPAEWIVVDLGSSQSLSSVTLKWNVYWATVYSIQVSTDNTNWTTVFSTSTGDGGTDTLSFAASTARYVRMYSTNWNHATERLRLNEIEIYQ